MMDSNLKPGGAPQRKTAAQVFSGSFSRMRSVCVCAHVLGVEEKVKNLKGGTFVKVTF